MMVHCLLSKHKSNNWDSYKDVSFRGWLFDESKLCNTDNMSWVDEFDLNCSQKRLAKLNGNYAMIIDNTSYTIAIVDRICSYPLYYAVRENDIYISDSIELLRDELGLVSIDINAKAEFLGSGFVFGNKTLFHGIHQLLAGQYLKIVKSSGELMVKDYFLHLHKDEYTYDAKEMCRRLNEVVTESIQRMIDSIHGRQIALFLSGGYDSKLIATTLKRLNYDSVICISLGSMTTRDVSVAKQIAETVGYPWIRIDVSKHMWRKYRKNGTIDKRVMVSAATNQLAYIQGMTLLELQESGVLAPNCVAITGNSGDAIEGADVTHLFFPGQTYAAEDIVNAIRNRHLVLSGYRYSLNPMLYKDIYPYLNLAFENKRSFTDEEAEEIYELFNWRERQAKYVVADARNYDDFLGIDWRLPLWDNAFVDFWLRVPYVLRYDRKLYYQYVQAETLPSANDITVPRKVIDWCKGHAKAVVAFLYPIKNICDYLFSNDYYFSSYGIVSFAEFAKIWNLTKGYRGAPHTPLLYYTWKLCYERYEGDKKCM